MIYVRGTIQQTGGSGLDITRRVFGGRAVTVYSSGVDRAPTVYVSMYEEAGAAVVSRCTELGCPAFNLVSVSGLDWNRDLSPWPADPVMNGGEGFSGGADDYLGFLVGDVVPYAEGILGGGDRVIAGYSMGGLFAVYAPFVTDAFTACVSASGSLWYPGFAEFAESHPFRSRPRSVYLSVGSREHRTPNPVMRTVNDCTSRILDRCVSEGVEAVFETNPGNHFRDGDLRLARGIAWTLSRRGPHYVEARRCGTMSAPRLYEDWTGNIVNGADIRSLDPGAVRAARAAFCERFPDRAEESAQWDDVTFLSRAGVFKRGKVTVAALILLGKPGERMIPSSVCIRWRLLDPDGSVIDSRTFEGPAVLTSTHAVSMIRNWSCRVGPEGSESVVSAYRTATLLEAVRNAVVHQDYGLGGTVEIVERENESVTVISMGSFPDRSPESFVTGPPPGAPRRDAFLYNAMAGLGIIPAAGSGIRSMYLSQAHRRFPMPDFDILGERVAVRLSGLRGGSYARVMDLRGDLDLKSVMDLDRVAKNRYVPDRRLKALVRRGLVEMIGDLPCIASGAGQEVASAYTSGTDQDAVMGLIRSKGYVTRSDVAEVLASRDGKGLTEEQLRVKATNLLQTMRKAGMVRKADGSTRSARYIASDPSRSD